METIKERLLQFKGDKLMKKLINLVKMISYLGEVLI